MSNTFQIINELQTKEPVLNSIATAKGMLSLLCCWYYFAVGLRAASDCGAKLLYAHGESVRIMDFSPSQTRTSFTELVKFRVYFLLFQ
jgi:hypothetical protein